MRIITPGCYLVCINKKLFTFLIVQQKVTGSNEGTGNILPCHLLPAKLQYSKHITRVEEFVYYMCIITEF